ncbi:MAG: hypothetical protein IT462_09265 [Planctomycetes bacterium]|nr:hypothetical protein [Planctomycetota bacterium]
MKTITLDWKGWWLLKQPMSRVPELAATCGLFAIVGAKLEKVGNGIGCSKREPIMFGAHKGGNFAEFIENLQKTAFGHFIRTRCEEIKKNPIVYVASLPVTFELPQLNGYVGLIYSKMPYLPRHHAVPPAHSGNPVKIISAGKQMGILSEVSFGASSNTGARTAVPELADEAMAAAIAADAQSTRIMSPKEAEEAVKGVATEKVAKPHAFETERVAKPLMRKTERYVKPGESGRQAITDDTAFDSTSLPKK